MLFVFIFMSQSQPPMTCPQVRALIADYAVILTIITFVAFDHYYGLATPKLIVPTIFKVGDGSDISTINLAVILLYLLSITNLSMVPKYYTWISSSHSFHIWLQPTRSDVRDWLIPMFDDKSAWYTYLLASAS